MNLQALFEKQAELDAHIEEQHPRQEGEDRLAKKILALQVELGELAQEQRSWKFWSDDQDPRTTIKCEMCDGLGNDIYFTGSERDGTLQENSEPCGYCDGMGNDDSENPLLEEFVDCLHFILSIGLEKGYQSLGGKSSAKAPNITQQFNVLFNKVGDFWSFPTKGNYQFVLGKYLELGEMLGFTEQEVLNAYDDKNATNHERQESGY